MRPGPEIDHHPHRGDRRMAGKMVHTVAKQGLPAKRHILFGKVAAEPRPAAGGDDESHQSHRRQTKAGIAARQGVATPKKAAYCAQ